VRGVDAEAIAEADLSESMDRQEYMQNVSEHAEKNSGPDFPNGKRPFAG
jgi:hypothetical protein